MERIGTLLEKISKLSKQGYKISQIDIDLMLDYTRVLYADLQEWRERITLNDSVASPNTPSPVMQPPTQEPTLETIAKNIEQKEVKHQPEPVQRQEPPIPPIPEPQVAIAQPKQESTATSFPERPKEEYVLSHPTKDIKKSIGINDKYLFISELFSNDKEAYEKIVEELNSFDDYQEAVDWLDNNIYREYQWDSDNETVQLFYSVLNNFFSLT